MHSAFPAVNIPHRVQGQITSSNNNAHLKSYLNNLYETILGLQESPGNHKKEMHILRSDKKILESVLTMKQTTRQMNKCKKA